MEQANKNLEWRTATSLLIGRSCGSAAYALSGFTTYDLLLGICNGDHVKARKTLGNVDMWTSFVTFMVTPMIGVWMDSFGRKPALVTSVLTSSFARAIVALYPSKRTYTLYRILNAVAGIPYMSSISAFLVDSLGKPGTPSYVRTSKAMWVVLALVRMVVIQISSKHLAGKEKEAFLLASVLTTFAGVIFQFQLKESLEKSKRRPFDIKRANPFASMMFFTQSKIHKLIAFAAIMKTLPTLNYTGELLQRQKYHLTAADRGQITQFQNLSEVLTPLVSVPLLKSLGNETLLIWAQRAHFLGVLHVLLSKYPVFARCFDPMFTRCFDGDNAFDGIVSQYIRGAGVGEVSSALSTLRFPVSLSMPRIYYEMYGYRFSLPQLVTMALYFINAEIVFPRVLQSLETLSSSSL